MEDTCVNVVQVVGDKLIFLSKWLSILSKMDKSVRKIVTFNDKLIIFLTL